jgi:hypothetical protein
MATRNWKEQFPHTCQTITTQSPTFAAQTLTYPLCVAAADWSVGKQWGKRTSELPTYPDCLPRLLGKYYGIVGRELGCLDTVQATYCNPAMHG